MHNTSTPSSDGLLQSLDTIRSTINHSTFPVLAQIDVIGGGRQKIDWRLLVADGRRADPDSISRYIRAILDLNILHGEKERRPCSPRATFRCFCRGF